ncbi:hypothetical protein COO60DRAFT_957815 [Scenedesmus sp. NREL 46B-D3]|nr:hypothetical protein COO60DRAFT_957815 [Scenedesmus sp. NREL 46B-D3]
MGAGWRGGVRAFRMQFLTGGATWLWLHMAVAVKTVPPCAVTGHIGSGQGGWRIHAGAQQEAAHLVLRNNATAPWAKHRFTCSRVSVLWLLVGTSCARACRPTSWL